MNYGVIAKKLLKRMQNEESPTDMACGAFIDEMDYFEQEKTRLMREFGRLTIDDDLQAMQKDYLV